MDGRNIEPRTVLWAIAEVSWEDDRMRYLSKDIQRASVLMALDAAGASVDDLLQEATRRQQALSASEAGQQKQLEEFEARKARENAQIQAEMDRVTAHHAERLQQNRDQVAREKEALRNWQMLKQHESQRISEVIEPCAKQPVPAHPGWPSRRGRSGKAEPPHRSLDRTMTLVHRTIQRPPLLRPILILIALPPACNQAGRTPPAHAVC